MITLACPGCDQIYQADENQLGRSLRCWKCGHAVPILKTLLQPAEPAPRRGWPRGVVNTRRWLLIASGVGVVLIVLFRLYFSLPPQVPSSPRVSALPTPTTSDRPSVGKGQQSTADALDALIETAVGIEAALERCIIHRFIDKAPNLVREGEPKPTLDDCRIVIGSQLPAPIRGTAYGVLGEALAAQGKHEEALRALREAVRLQPRIWDPHQKLGRTLEQVGRREEALRSYKEALRLLIRGRTEEEVEPLLLADVQIDIGRILLRLDRVEEGLHAYQEAAWLTPDNAEVWGRMGVAAAALGYREFDRTEGVPTALARPRLRQAMSFWERALRIDPSYFDTRPAEREAWESVLSWVGPQKPERVNRTAESRDTVVQFTPGQRIYVDARLNGTGNVRLILDTGADFTMVAPAALTRLGIVVPTTADTEITGVTGSRRVPVAWVRSVSVGKAVAGPLPVVAHDADLKQADGLLGRDFLNHFTVTIDNAAGRVTLRPK